MPWFAAGRMIPEFSKPAFELENPGDMTRPVETQFGFHIIKKIDERPVPSFEESRTEIETRIQRDPARSQSSRKIFVEKLKNEYNFSENTSNFKKLETLTIDAKPEKELILFTIDSKSFGLSDFRQYLKKEIISNKNMKRSAILKGFTIFIYTRDCGRGLIFKK